MDMMQKITIRSARLCKLCSAGFASKPRKLGKPDLSEKKMNFVDWKRVEFRAGNGGDGCVSMRREAYAEFGGPDGGDGGTGGDVILEAASRMKSLEHLSYVYKGEHGGKGSGGNCSGKSGKHAVIQVPLGTILKEDQDIVCDLEKEGDQTVVVYGGLGGRGNKSFVTSNMQAPMVATKGQQGQQRKLALELKTIAHAGLVGFPNAGKSSLLRALSRARPKVAAYPFTTLNPHVGIIEYPDLEQVAVADIPGLIPGAHLNKGLGHSFLRHIDRCLCLLYVIDLSQKDPWDQFTHLQYELEQYQPHLSERPHAIIGNKIDLPESQSSLSGLQERVDIPVIGLSAKFKTNIDQLKMHVRKLYDEDMKDRRKESTVEVLKRKKEQYKNRVI
ncbi:mitochondrial ribosome-associated GTPase 2-like [Apostichopus japonicus]|uniref:mitochondrial ribosome-associated GTPase 2-like n=1 Tax=Stichopus japonicus TaxID=307972 RepID=UPI003AB506BB